MATRTGQCKLPMFGCNNSDTGHTYLSDEF